MAITLSVLVLAIVVVVIAAGVGTTLILLGYDEALEEQTALHAMSRGLRLFMKQVLQTAAALAFIVLAGYFFTRTVPWAWNNVESYLTGVSF